MYILLSIITQVILPTWQDSIIRRLDLPVVRIETVNQEYPTFDIAYKADNSSFTICNATKVPGRMLITLHNDTIYDSGEYIQDQSGLTIKVRGNQSSVDGTKPSYKLKLQKKAELLGRNEKIYKDKDWALIKENQLRFRTGFLINRLLGMDWTPAYQYCNVVLNGEIKGLYMLCETIKNTSSRIPAGNNGFITEYDAYYWNESFYVPSRYYYGYTFKDPEYEDLSVEEQDSISELITLMDQSFGSDNPEKYIDIPSFAKWILAQDILGQGDAAGSNLYMYHTTKDTLSRFRVPTLWDFDANEKSPSTFCPMHTIQMFRDLFSRSDSLVNTYIREWKRVEPFIFDSVIAHMQEYMCTPEAAALDISRTMGIKYQIPINNYPDYATTVAQDAQRVINWMRARRTFLADAISAIEDIRSGTVDLKYSSIKNSSIIGYYTLDGRKADKSSRGILVVRFENGSSKLISR